MLSVLFYISVTFLVISAVAIVVVGIWWQILVSETFRRNEERMNLPLPALAFLNIGVYNMIRFAEKVDKGLARKMRRLMLVGAIAFCGFVGFGLLAFLTGGAVFGGWKLGTTTSSVIHTGFLSSKEILSPDGRSSHL